jgi:hypothetical protein
LLLAEEAEAACLATEAEAVKTPTAAATKVKLAKQDQVKNKNLSRLMLELRKYVKAKEEVCPDQAEHLLEERIWKSCRLC